MSENTPSIDAVDLEDTTESIEGEFKPTKLNRSEMVRRNSTDQYKSAEAVPRELISNSVGGIRLAKAKNYINENEGQIKIKLIEVDGRWKFVLQDNGIGLTEQKLENLREMGVSEFRNDDTVTGKYGIGFYAIFKALPEDGQFILESISRETGYKSTCIWKLNGRKQIPQDPDLGSEMDFGTKISLILKSDLDIDDMIEWVTRHARASRELVTVEIDREDSETEVTEYPHLDVIDSVKEETQIHYSLDNEYVSVIAGPDIREDVFVLDNAMDLNRRIHVPWNVSMRIHTEESTIAFSDEREKIGLKVIETSMYESLHPDDKNEYIPKENLEDSDIITPSPTGSRDSLSHVDQFVDYLQQEVKTYIGNELKRINANIPNITQNDLALLYSVFGVCQRYSDIKTAFDTDGYISRNNVAKFLELLELNTKVVETSLNINEHKKYCRKPEEYKYISPSWLATKSLNSDLRVYMCIGVNDLKSKVVRNMDGDYIIIEVDGAEDYKRFNYDNWMKLKDISLSNIEDYELSAEVVAEIQEERSKTEERQNETQKLTVRNGTDRLKSMNKVTLSDLKLYVGSSTKKIAGDYTLNKLVLFPDGGSEKVSDHYTLGGEKVGVAKCSDEEAEELFAANENIISYEEYYQSSLEKTYYNGNGVKKSGKQLSDVHSDVIVLLLDESSFGDLDPTLFNNQVLCQIIESQTYSTSSINRLVANPYDLEIIIVSQDTERELRPALRELYERKENHSTDEVYVAEIDDLKRRESPDWFENSVSLSYNMLYTHLNLQECEYSEDKEMVEKYFGDGKKGTENELEIIKILLDRL